MMSCMLHFVLCWPFAMGTLIPVFRDAGNGECFSFIHIQEKKTIISRKNNLFHIFISHNIYLQNK